MRERGGNVIAKVIEERTKERLIPIVNETVKLNSVVMRDEFIVYKNFGKHFDHHSVNHSAKQFVNGMAHTNGIENFWSH